MTTKWLRDTLPGVQEHLLCIFPFHVYSRLSLFSVDEWSRTNLGRRGIIPSVLSDADSADWVVELVMPELGGTKRAYLYQFKTEEQRTLFILKYSATVVHE